MHLTSFTDYTLRLLLMAYEANGELITIEDAATRFKVSHAHLSQVANRLTQSGILTAVRGRSGGLRLERSAARIRIGDIVRLAEPSFTLVECFDPKGECQLAEICKLPPVLHRALVAFMSVLDGVTLAEMALTQHSSRSLLKRTRHAR